MQSDSATAAAPQPRASTLTPVALLAMTFDGWPPRPSRHCIRKTSLCNRSSDSSMQEMTAVAPDLKRWITACMCMFPIVQTFIIQNCRHLAKSSLFTVSLKGPFLLPVPCKQSDSLSADFSGYRSALSGGRFHYPCRPLRVGVRGVLRRKKMRRTEFISVHHV
jgi:hypothetical protein